MLTYILLFKLITKPKYYIYIFFMFKHQISHLINSQCVMSILFADRLQTIRVKTETRKSPKGTELKIARIIFQQFILGIQKFKSKRLHL